VHIPLTDLPLQTGYRQGVIQVKIWIVNHWLELVLLLTVLAILLRLRFVHESIEGVRAASATNVLEVRSVDTKLAEIAFEVDKIRKDDYGAQILDELRAISRDIKDASEVIVYGKEARDRRLSAEREARSSEYRRRLIEMQEKAKHGDVQAQGFYAAHREMRDDYVGAHTWYSIALASVPDWQHGITKRAQIAKLMTVEELAEAEHDARSWLVT
jgi:hypothetical protein